MSETVEVMSKLAGTHPPEHDAELRQRIRDYARDHGERYSARLFALLEEDRQFSELVEELLNTWLKSRT